MSDLGNKEIMARNLKLFMDDAGESQRELAKILHVSKSAVNDWCTARSYPRIDKIQMMADHWHIMMSDLVEDKTDLFNKAKSATQLDDGLSREKKAFLERIKTMSDDEITKLNQIADLVLQGR